MKDLYGRLMIDINGKNLSEEDKFIISNKHVGGLILFSRNFESFEQLQNLISEINSIKEKLKQFAWRLEQGPADTDAPCFQGLATRMNSSVNGAL